MLARLTRSLSGRLLTAALAVLLIFLSLTGYVLDRAFSKSVEMAARERLETRLYAILAVTELRDGRLLLPENLPEPDFNRLDSGLYAFVQGPDGQELWRSQSAIAFTAPTLPALTPGEQRFVRNDTNSGSARMLAYHRRLIWEDDQGGEIPFITSILQSDVPVMAEIHGFRGTLWRWLGGICIVLLVAQWLIMRWGLAPLRHLAREIRQIETGAQDQLSGNYPTELLRTTSNLNLLISNERRQRQKYHDTLADLAHSLKTPLAVLRGITNEAASGKDPGYNKDATASMEEQIVQMDQIISYQLQRASGANHALSMQPVAIQPVVDKLLRNLQKVYADKTVQLTNQVDPECSFVGDERDLLEVLGNLLDNAFKACHKQISICASATQTEAGSQQLEITVDDDGDGVPVEQRRHVLERGGRADTRHSGQGIGLAVAVDIISSYGGLIGLSDSALGGASFNITIPQQAKPD